MAANKTGKPPTAEQVAADEAYAALVARCRAEIVGRDQWHRRVTGAHADIDAGILADALLDPENAAVAASWQHGWIGLDVHPETGEVVVVGKKTRVPSVATVSPHLIGG